MKDDIVIVGAARTPVGAFNGAFASLPAHDLGKVAIKAALERAGVEPARVSEVILGQILQAGQGQRPGAPGFDQRRHPGRGPGLERQPAVRLGAARGRARHQPIVNGDSEIVVAGGQESMSLAPHCAHLRSGVKMGDFEMVDTMIKDGLWDAFNGYHMGNTAENVARQWQITREEQDEFAVASQNKAEAAQKAGRFKDEIVPGHHQGPQGRHRRRRRRVPQARRDARGGRASCGPPSTRKAPSPPRNASGINDGAAAVVLMKASEAAKRGMTPLARIVSWAQAGVDPEIMGTGPIPASRTALEKAGWTVGDLDLIEANEAFAAQACAVNKDLGWDTGKVNVNGGAIAIGHPIGASGARVLMTLLHEMQKRNAKKGLATLCIGGGMGIAMCVERIERRHD